MSDTAQNRSTAKDVFSHLLMIIMLYVGVITFLAMVFSLINLQLPDALDVYRQSELSTIRTSISSLLVVWPVFILVSWMIGKNLKQNIWVRKWLLYLTLFIASLTVVIDLVTLVNTFLNGEITTRFVLKVLAVLVVAAAVFAYYLWDLRRDPKAKTSRSRMGAILTSLVILATIVGGFFLIGTPGEQRDVRLDEERVSDLQNIQSNIISFWKVNQELPETIDDISTSLEYFSAPSDPETDEAYGYVQVEELVYQVCATFASEADSNTENLRVPSPKYAVFDASAADWGHEAGYVCFERTINPELFSEGKGLE